MDPITNHVDAAKERVITQFKDDVYFNAILEALVNQIQDAEDVITDLITKRSLTTAVGVQLDLLGGILGQPRVVGDTDGEYRVYLLLKIARIMSEGTPEDLLNIFTQFVQADDVYLTEHFPAFFVLTAENPTLLGSSAELAEILLYAKAAGVGFALVGATDNPFTFDGDPDGAGFSSLADPTEGGEWSWLL